MNNDEMCVCRFPLLHSIEIDYTVIVAKLHAVTISETSTHPKGGKRTL